MIIAEAAYPATLFVHDSPPLRSRRPHSIRRRGELHGPLRCTKPSRSVGIQARYFLETISIDFAFRSHFVDLNDAMVFKEQIEVAARWMKSDLT
jgi:hypothetical protein